MNSQKAKTFLALLSLIATILACNAPDPNAATQAPATEAVSAPPTELPLPAATEVPIEHLITPIDLPADRSSHAGDYDSSTTAGSKVAAGGDRFSFERFERPFNADTMDQYFAELDIVDTFVFQDKTWIFATIVLNSLDAANASGAAYAVELDTDLDGKGDWLVKTPKPASTDWSVDGVVVFEDVDSSVGDLSPMYTDENAGGDGFETKAFDQGDGSDPDAAWSRLSPEGPNTIEVAVKRSLLGDPSKYMISMWAGTTLLDPALFDLNDHFSHEQAGAADAALQVYYPIKQVFELDNSCRMAVGFQPTGKEPGLCETLISPPGPGDPPLGCQLTAQMCYDQGMDYDFSNCKCVEFG